jgi:opacity protein-like surface antigen
MKRTLILSVVVLVVLTAKGFAQPVVLTCTQPSNDRETKLTFDESAGTASWAGDDSSRASFTDREIKWSSREVNTIAEYNYEFTLSRVTGTLTEVSFCHPTSNMLRCPLSNTTVWHCEASQKKF